MQYNDREELHYMEKSGVKQLAASPLWNKSIETRNRKITENPEMQKPQSH
jgi:hypothetical protein